MKGLWLALFTIREAIIKGTLLFYFVFGNIVIALFAIAIGSSTQNGLQVLTFFGNQITPPIADLNPVDFILFQLFQGSTQAVILLGLFATAGLIPSMLEKGTVELYLSKPLSRTEILLSRSLGACGGIGANVLYFSIGIWLVFGFKVGVWHGGFLLASLMVVVTYAFYFSFVALSAVISKGTGLTIMLSFAYQMYAGVMEAREMLLYRLWDNDMYHRLLDGLYYATPQTSAMLNNSAILIGQLPFKSAMTPTEFTIMPFLYSFLSAALFYGGASWYFSRQDY
ncbi:MAG TPA: hypothetical protein VJN65_08310 [Bacteroidota bacterium]|nr:hypothetical protein [Bacteroidota bacterium]